MSVKRITDTARLDWLIANISEVVHVLPEVGPGWIREEGWRLRVGNGYHYVKERTLRASIDKAMKSVGHEAEQSSTRND